MECLCLGHPVLPGLLPGLEIRSECQNVRAFCTPLRGAGVLGRSTGLSYLSEAHAVHLDFSDALGHRTPFT